MKSNKIRATVNEERNHAFGVDIDILSEIMHALPGHVYWKDSNGALLGCNLKQAQSLGANCIEDVLGKTDFDFVNRNIARDIRNNDLKVMTSGQTMITKEIYTLLNSERVFLSHKTPLKNSIGEILGVLGVSLDITEQVELLAAFDAQAIKHRQKTYVASLTGLSRQDKDFLKSKSCIVSISVGGAAHEGEQFKATLNMVNARFKKCLIIMGDTLQRHNIAMTNSELDATEACNLAKLRGDEWLQRNEPTILNELHIPYKIIRWNHCVDSDAFHGNLEKTKKLYDNNMLFKAAVHEVIEEFISRYTKRIPTLNKQSIIAHSLDYFLEECACMLQWFEEGYEYEIYPSKRARALSYFFEIMEPERSLRLLRAARVRCDNIVTNTVSDMHQITINHILELMPGHIYWKDKYGVYLGCNLQQAQSYRLNDVQSLIGKSDFDIFAYDVALDIRRNDLKVMRSGKLLITEESAEILGKHSTFLSYKVPLKDHNSTVIGILGVSLNITEQKEIAKQLEEKNQLLTEAIKAKQDFLRNISHEIRTPMSCILKMSNLLYEDWEKYPNNEARKAHLKMAVEGNNRLQSVLLNLLDLSKVSTGKMQYNKIPYSLKQSVQDVIREFIDQQYRIHLNCRCGPGEEDFSGVYDHFRIEQVIRNLLANSISYGESDDINITLSLDKDFLVFDIVDQGVGIPKDELDSIFQIFTQSSRTSTGAGGTGIGLSISKTIIEDHGGCIYAQNNKSGKGSRFTFKFPINPRASANEPDRTAINTDDATGTKQSHDDKPTLLVIDDDISILQVSELVFNRMGFKTILANSGTNGLETLYNYSDIITVVLLDIMMPDICGVDVLRTIKADANLSKIPVYMYTGISDMSDTINEAIKIGASGCIDKTSSSEKIASILGGLIKSTLGFV